MTDTLARKLVALLVAAGGLTIPAADLISVHDVEIGNQLQTSVLLTLAGPLPAEGAEITVASEDPGKVLFAPRPDQAGRAWLTLKLQPGAQQLPEFWVQALADEGTVEYTATEPRLGTARGTVKLYPSGIIVSGPMRGPSFAITPRGGPAPISVQTVRLDGSRRVLEVQQVAGGRTVKVQVRSSNSGAGVIDPETIEIPGGAAAALTVFKPVAVGTTEIDVVAPVGFATPAEHARVDANVNLPGIMLTDDGVLVGQNLQMQAAVGLGERAPEEGIAVRVASSDPSRLLISRSATEAGAGEVEVLIPAGEVSAPVYLQALARSGVVKCTASAPGYRSRTSEIHLAPSGVVLMYKPYGPPDEAEVLRQSHSEISPTTALYVSLAKTKKLPLNIWTVRLDPVTLRSADITVQPVRGGYSLEVTVQSSNTEVGTVSSPVKIGGGSEVGVTEFLPASPGKSTVSVITPEGFVQSTNSTSVTAVIAP